MRGLRLRATGFALVLVAGCGGTSEHSVADAGPPTDGSASGGDGGPFTPDQACPGAAGCEDTGDGILHAGAARVEITPIIDDRTDILTTDVDGDGSFEPEQGDVFADRDDHPGFDGVWMAGYGNARAASGVNDPQWVRAVALRENQTTIVFVEIDCIGYFLEEADAIRAMVADLGVDFVSIGGTHDHEARDTIGLWGVDEYTAGYDLVYLASVRDRAAMAIRMAVSALRPAHVQYAVTRLRDQEGGATRYAGDARDPQIHDDEVRVMRFAEATGGATIGTIVNWGSHPEYGGDENTLLSSDYPNWLRDGVENGVDLPDGTHVDGVGGVAMFVPGALGGQMGAYGGWQARTWAPGFPETTPPGTRSLATAEFIGKSIARFVLAALGPSGGSVTDETAALGFRRKRLFVDVQNRGFHIALLGSIFLPRQSYNWDPDAALVPGRNEPDLMTEVSVIDVGRAQILGVPGELDPCLFVGGYDGSWTPAGLAILDPANTNPPDLARAPAPPYLRDLARPDAEYVMLFGLSNDYLGYFVPAFDFVLDRTSPYIDEAPGDHYEETRAVGTDGWPTIESNLRALLAWSR